MKLLKVYFDHLKMFEDGKFDIDLFASDRVPSSDESVFELLKSIYSNNLVAFAGINATGKTTALNLIELACRIVDGSPLRGMAPSLSTLFNEETNFRCLVWNEGQFFLIESEMDTNPPGDGEFDEACLGFFEEHVYSVSPNNLKRTVLSSWEGIKAEADLLYRRTEVKDSWVVMSAVDTSIAAAVMRGLTGVRNRAMLLRDDGFRLKEGFEGLDSVLKVFDSRIEHLEVEDAGRAFVLTFANAAPLTLSAEGLAEVLSSGTVRGLALVQRAMAALKSGGYLLVDEIENHLNRQLVNVILDLFTSEETNPRGATLVFTTHYPQLLDHIHRKDNVYFIVRKSSGMELVKYSSRVKRIENKKSEVFASNYIPGTAPRYTDVKILRDLVSGVVGNE